MRVRILKQPTGTVDGIELWRLVEGRVYDVPASLATLLVVSQWAESIVEEWPALVVPLDHPVVELLDRRERETADDRPPRRRKGESRS